MIAVAALTDKYFNLLNIAKIDRAPLAKVRLVNMWRTTPFVDTKTYLEICQELGMPVLEDDLIMCPPGSSPESLLQLKPLQCGDAASKSDAYYGRWHAQFAPLAFNVLMAVGVVRDISEVDNIADIYLQGVSD